MVLVLTFFIGGKAENNIVEAKLQKERDVIPVTNLNAYNEPVPEYR